jgi:DNA-binding CsgD family transcriptional regulator
MVQYKKTELARDLLKRFHDIVNLNTIQLEKACQYLFEDYSLPNLGMEFNETLIYLKEIVIENQLEGISELIHYYDCLAFDADKAMTETIKGSIDTSVINIDHDFSNQPSDNKKSYIGHINNHSVCLIEQTVISSTGVLTTSKFSMPALGSRLNKREIEFLKLACTEMTYKEIAGKMFLSVRTIDGYRDALFAKLNLKSRVGLVLYAIKNGIVGICDSGPSIEFRE